MRHSCTWSGSVRRRSCIMERVSMGFCQNRKQGALGLLKCCHVTPVPPITTTLQVPLVLLNIVSLYHVLITRSNSWGVFSESTLSCHRNKLMNHLAGLTPPDWKSKSTIYLSSWNVVYIWESVDLSQKLVFFSNQPRNETRSTKIKQDQPKSTKINKDQQRSTKINWVQ